MYLCRANYLSVLYKYIIQFSHFLRQLQLLRHSLLHLRKVTHGGVKCCLWLVTHLVHGRVQV